MEQIESIQVVSITFRAGRWRAWDSTTVKSWMLLNDGHLITTGITPANPKDFIAVLKALNPKVKVSQRK